MRYALVLLFCSAAMAEPTTRPRDPAPLDAPVTPIMGQVADPARPAYVPAFTQVNQPSTLSAEREWAYRFSYPAGGWYGGCYGYPFYSRPVFWGASSVPFHGFYR
jgi:hypothetical protein